MKKISVALILISLAVCAALAACSTSLNSQAEAPDVAKTPVVSNSPLAAEPDATAGAQSKAYQDYKLLSQKSDIQPVELISFFKSNRASFSKEEVAAVANDLALKVDAYYNSQLDKFNELQETKEDLYNLTEVSYSSSNRVVNEPIAADEASYLNTLIDNGLMIYFAEGLVLDYDANAFLALFDDGAKGEGVDFMRIIQTEQKEPSTLEGMVQINPEEMVARYESVVTFIGNYPDSSLLTRCEPMIDIYLKFILVQDWELFDYETGKVRDDSRSILMKYAHSSKGTSLEPVMSQFLALLEKEGFQKTEAITNFLGSNGIFEY